jgi:hypothetical protein
MIQYELVNNTDIFKFMDEVQEMLNDGWKIEGNLVVHQDSENVEWFYQAMTRVVEEEVTAKSSEQVRPLGLNEEADPE